MKMEDVDVDEASIGILLFVLFSLSSHLCHFVCLFVLGTSDYSGLIYGSVLGVHSWQGLGDRKRGQGLSLGTLLIRKAPYPLNYHSSLL